MAGELIINSEFSRPYLLSDGKEKEVNILLDIFPSPEVRNKFEMRKSNNNGVDLCLVLDKSESMTFVVSEEGIIRTGKFGYSEGRRVEYVENATSKFQVAVKACEHLINVVRPEDNISLIVYNDNPEIIFTNISGDNKEFMINSLKNIKPEGNTNISVAISNAKMLLSNNNNGKVKKIIFLTDGVPTCDTEEAAIREAGYLKYDNINIDCLGIGKDIKYSFLEKLSICTNGRTDIIENEKNAKDIFEKLFENAKDVIIDDVKVTIRNIGPYVRVNDHYTATPEKKYLGKAKLGLERKMSLNIGQVEKDQLYRYFLQATIRTPVEKRGLIKIMDIEMEYKIPALYGNETFTVSKSIAIECGTIKERANERIGKVENGLKLVLIKRLEDELEAAYNLNDEEKVIKAFKDILSLYEELGNTQFYKIYQKQLKEYIDTNNIDMQALNENRNSSSRQDDSGSLMNDLKIKDIVNLL